MFFERGIRQRSVGKLFLKSQVFDKATSLERVLELTMRGMEMDALASILEEEFALAFEVKDVKLLTVEMKEGFKRMDKRFLSLESRFNRLSTVISLGFLVITVMITIFQFMR